jgi:hypothetical protein
MRAIHALLLGLAVVVLLGCGGTRPPSRVAAHEESMGVAPEVGEDHPKSAHEMSAMAASVPAAPGSESAAQTGVEAPGRAEAEISEPPPQERPGLGTEWGETRVSHVHETSFSRATPGRPFAVADFFYNDRSGVDALAAYHGGATRRTLDVLAADGTITMYLLDKEWGMPLDAMRVGGRTYVVGEVGHRYSIVIENRTGRRVEAVATVDGLDVINGRAGSYENRGYLLEPWSMVEIDGFRKSEDEVAAFRFSKIGDSYAAERGKARNVGVIGVAFFAEAGGSWWRDDLRMRDTAKPFSEDRRFAPPP